MRQLISRAKPWQVVLIFCLIYLMIVLAGAHFDSKVFVTLGSDYADCQSGIRPTVSGLPNGYDGQFNYYIARDPANAASCIDVPAYRYQRILLPILGHIISLGSTDAIPLAFVLINLIALVGSTWLLTDLLQQRRVSRWYALVYGLFVGALLSVRLSTSEPLAYGLVILGIWFGERKQPWPQALALLAAVLAKETALTFVAGYLLYDLFSKDWRHMIRLALVVGIPFAIWQIVLYKSFGTFGAGSGGAGNTPFEIIPFNGYLRLAYDPTSSPKAFLVLSLYIFPAVIIPTLWALYATIRDLWQRRIQLYTCLLFANAAVMVFVPFSTYREPIGLFRFIVGLVIAHLLYASVRYPRARPMLYSTLWLVLLFYLVAG